MLKMCNHRLFNIISVVVFLINTVFGVLYNYYIAYHPTLTIYRFAFKPVPVTLLIILVFCYIRIYRMHFYALLTGVGLLFCLMGDTLLMFYIPEVDGYNVKLFLMIGGVSFFIARGFFTIASIVFPYRGSSEKTITIPIKKTFIIGLLCFVWTAGMIVTFFINMNGGVLKYLLPIYFLMMGVELMFSIVRIRGFPGESLSAQIKGLIGTVLFTVSDSILFYGLFINPIMYGDIISISLYWLGMYFLTISVVRSPEYVKEKRGVLKFTSMDLI